MSSAASDLKTSATTSAPQPGRPPAAQLAVLVFLAFASGHFLSFGLRTLNAALAPYLVADLQLNAADLGWLSASYFVTFACLQYPLGFWLDRYGERRVESLLLLFAAAGAIVMGLADSLAVVTLGRALIGLGVATCLMAPFAWFRRNYPPHRQAQLSLWLLMAGTSGAVMSTLPAAMLAEWLGWRGVLLLLGGLLAISAALIWFVVPDPVKPTLSQQQAQTTQPPISLVRDKAMLDVMPLAFFGHGGVMALHTLWVGPWMTQVLGLSASRTAAYLFIFMFTIMVGYLAMSFISPRLQQRNITLTNIAYVGHILTVLCLLSIIALPYPPTWILWPCIALLIPAMSLMQPGMSLRFPRSVAGRALTLYNLYLFGGAFAVQWGIGLGVDLLERHGLSTASAFRSAFALMLSIYVICLVYWRLRSRHYLAQAATPAQGSAKT